MGLDVLEAIRTRRSTRSYDPTRRLPASILEALGEALTAQSLGVSSCPVRSFHARAVQQVLGLPEDIVPELLITLGYADQPPRPKTSKPAREVISYDRYGKEHL